MDERYLKALIYTISNINYPSKTYVGSTIDFKKRINKHHSVCKINPNILLYSYINNDWENWIFTIYEHYPCNNKIELKTREGEIIKQIGTLNKNIAGRDYKQYYNDNLDKKKEYDRQRYTINKDNIKQKQRKYYNENKDKIKQYYIEKKLLRVSNEEKA